MATKKTSSKKTSSKKISSKKTSKAVKAIEVTSLKVTRARAYEDMYFFDMILNGVCIYGCRLIEGENGWFVAFPSKKPTKKNGKWYNHCWANLDDDTTTEICSEVMEICGDDDDDDDDDDDYLPF